MWRGDTTFVLENLILKDFRIRYRNMSLGVFWSLLNPLVMMVVLTFVFTLIFPSPSPDFPIFVLCGLIPVNFFGMAWSNGTSSITDNAGLIKRVPMPGEIVPVASVLSNCLHLLIQIGLLLALTLAWGKSVNPNWIWLPAVLVLFVGFVCGLALLFSGLHVYVRDTRYAVESANTMVFWLVPVMYSHAMVPRQFVGIYELNPVAAVVMAMRDILLDARAPRTVLMIKLAAATAVMLMAGHFVFSRLRKGFYRHL